MKRRSASGSVVGRANLASRASSIIVSGAERAVEMGVQLRLGQAARAAHASASASCCRPARAHDHPEDRAGRERRVERQLDAAGIGDERGAGGGARLQRRIVRTGARRGRRCPAATSTGVALTNTRMLALIVGWRRRPAAPDASTGCGSRRRNARDRLDVDQAAALVPSGPPAGVRPPAPPAVASSVASVYSASARSFRPP